MKIVTVLWAVFVCLSPARPTLAQEISIDKASISQQVAAFEKQKDAAIARVKAIVNQPVQAQPTNSWAMVEILPGGWYTKADKEPDYEKVDVRATQEFPYAAYAHVSSTSNPNEMFSGPQLEVNATTKFFYTDDKTPKKRLSQAEMLEINKLYRVIGACNKRITQLNDAPETMLRLKYFFRSAGGTVGLLVLVSGAFLLIYRKLYPSRR